MKHFCLFVAFLFKTVLALPNYTPPATNGYQNDGYASNQNDGYASNQRCTYVDEVTYTEKCEDYTDQVCYTTYHEQCDDIYDQTCRAFVSKSQTRQCFNVTETICMLKEEVSYEVIDAVFTVQKCSRAHDRVCDTVVELQESKQHRDECVNVPSLVCTTEERTVFEKTCRTETKFDCGTDKKYTGVGYDQNSATYAASGAYDSYEARQQQSGYDRDEPATASYEKSGYNSGSYGSAQHQEVYCEKHQEKRCNTNPRTVESQTCASREEKVCERLTERIQKPYEKQNCRNEEKKVCRVEQKTQPKQVKMYSYKQVCRPMEITRCDNADDYRLVPSCVPTTRHVCRSVPSEKCEDVPRKHCFNIPTTVRKQKCETVDSYANEVHTAPYQDSYANEVHTAPYQDSYANEVHTANYQ